MANGPYIVDGAPVPSRLPVLDGWRAVSILSVLSAHMLPLGPKPWMLNDAAATMGMSIFFTLSGFLIAGILWRNQDVGAFLVKRITRIVPLAWSYLTVVLAVGGASAAVWIANFFFYANLPPFYLEYAGHFWSLGLEMQFYLCVAVLVALLGRRGLYLLPLLALVITGVRIWTGTHISIVSWLRGDEILAGAILALISYGAFGERVRAIFRVMPLALAIILFVASSHAASGPLNYFRPYLTILMVGATLYQPRGYLCTQLESRPMGYVAKISYALYVIHPATMMGWLGSGGTVTRYMKRPICFLLTFAFAHFSTFHFEKRFNDWSHGLVKRRAARRGGLAGESA